MSVKHLYGSLFRADIRINKPTFSQNMQNDAERVEADYCSSVKESIKAGFDAGANAITGEVCQNIVITYLVVECN